MVDNCHVKRPLHQFALARVAPGCMANLLGKTHGQADMGAKLSVPDCGVAAWQGRVF